MSVIGRYRLPLSLFAALALSGAAAAAPSPEGASSAAQAAFEQAVLSPLPRMPKRVVSASFPQLPAAPAAFRPVVFSQAGSAGPGTLVRELDLAGLLNRQLKTSLTFTLGGKTVWLSGAFDRTQDAYVSILVDGQAPQFFNVKDLLTDPKSLAIGTAKYRLSLSPDLVDQLESEIVLTNEANRRDKQRVALEDMLSAISDTGESVQVGGETYKCFYYDDVKGGTRSFAFILTDAGGEFHVFLVPSELVPSSGRPASFKMHNNTAVGLLQVNGKLRVFAL